jgi:hypothetical protein
MLLTTELGFIEDNYIKYKALEIIIACGINIATLIHIPSLMSWDLLQLLYIGAWG